MKRPKEHVIENISSIILRNKLPESWILRDIEPDYGLDKTLEIVEGEVVTGKEILIQLKGTRTPNFHHDYLSFSLNVSNLLYYMERDTPILLIVVDINTEDCYWVFLQKYVFQVLNIEKPNWDKQKTITLRIPRCQKVSNKIDEIIEIAKGGTAYIIINKINQIPSKYLTNWITDTDAIKAKLKVSTDLLEKAFQLKFEISYHHEKEGDKEKSIEVLYEIYQSGKGAANKLSAVKAGLMIAYQMNPYTQNEELWKWLNEIMGLVEEVDNNSLNLLWRGSMIETIYLKLVQDYNALTRLAMVSSQTPSGLMTPYLVLEIQDKVAKLYDLEMDFIDCLNKAYLDEEYFVYLDFIKRFSKMHWLWVYNNSLKGNPEIIFKQLGDIEQMLLFAKELSIIISEDSKFMILMDLIYLYHSMELFKKRDSVLKEAKELAEELKHKGYIQDIDSAKDSFEHLKTIPFLLNFDELKGSTIEPTFEQEEELIKSLLKDGGIDVEKGTDEYANMARIGLKDRNPERILKYCEYLYTEVVTYGPVWEPFGLPETGLKILYCEKKGSKMGPSLDELLFHFKQDYCKDCKDRKQRPSEWKWTREWHREREIPEGMKRILDNYRK